MQNPKHCYPKEKYIQAGVKGNPPCPICGKDWCGYTSFGLVSCMRIKEGAFAVRYQENGQPCYLHWLKTGVITYNLTQEDSSVKTVEIAQIEQRDRVYREFVRVVPKQPGQ